MNKYKTLIARDPGELEALLNQWGKQDWEIEEVHPLDGGKYLCVMSQWVSSRTKIEPDEVRMLSLAGEWAYKNEVVETHMEEHIIGAGKEYADKEDWIEGWLREITSIGKE